MRSKIFLIMGLFIMGLTAACSNPGSAPDPANYTIVYNGKEITFSDQMLYLVIALEIYRTHVGNYPSNEAGLRALISQPEIHNASGEWRGPYAESEVLFYDPWQRELQYQVDENGRLDLRSLGPDGERSGDDLKASEMFPDVFREMQKLSEAGPLPIQASPFPTQRGETFNPK